MAESDPSKILVIDKTKKRSKYANDEPGVQLLIDQIGGIHNIHLARLWSARKFLLVEGKDVGLLKQLHSVLNPDAELPLDTIPSHSVGGWSGWSYAVGSSMAMKNAVGDQIAVYCILDPDYRSLPEIRGRYEDAERKGVKLHVWGRKEIENFVLIPRAIRRVLALRIKDREAPSEEIIWCKILEICEQERRTTEDGIASAIVQFNRKLDLMTANKTAREVVEREWKSPEKKPILVSGKDILARMSEWTQAEFGTSFGAPAIARQVRKSEIPDEMAEVLLVIDEGREFEHHEDRLKGRPIFL